MKWSFKVFIIFVYCGFYARKLAGIQETILDKYLQFRLVRVSIEVNLILTCRSCSKLWSTGLGRDIFVLNKWVLGHVYHPALIKNLKHGSLLIKEMSIHRMVRDILHTKYQDVVVALFYKIKSCGCGISTPILMLWSILLGIKNK